MLRTSRVLCLGNDRDEAILGLGHACKHLMGISLDKGGEERGWELVPAAAFARMGPNVWRAMGKRRIIAGEEVASAARQVATICSRLYWKISFVSAKFNGTEGVEGE